MRTLSPLVWLWAAGCPALTGRDVDLLSDQDGDGFTGEDFGGQDCDDRDPAVHPRAPEVCNGVDDDCDLLVNEADPDLEGVDWYRDADHDGYGDEASHLRTCQALGGLPGDPWIGAGPDGEFDCDDQDGDEHPGQVWRFDGDGDGFAVCSAPTRVQCARPDGHVVNRLPEDQAACDEAVRDDEDVRAVADCDDRNPAISPTFGEVCNGRDDDCDGLADDDDDTVIGVLTTFPDEDGDGFGAGSGVSRCAVTKGYVEVGGDCNDDPDDPEAPDQKPGAPDPAYDGIDGDCDGWDDFDFDRDGEASDQYAGSDCDDFAPWIHTGAVEICDGLDSDCDGNDAAGREQGATFVAADVAVGPPHLKGFSDLTQSLTDGDTVYVPGEGTVWLCDDQVWTGRIEALVGGEITVRSPVGHPATLTPFQDPIVISLQGQVVVVRDLNVVDGAIYLTSTDRASEVSGVVVTSVGYLTPLTATGPMALRGTTIDAPFGSYLATEDRVAITDDSHLTSSIGQPIYVSGTPAATTSLTVRNSTLTGASSSIVSAIDDVVLDSVTLIGDPELTTQAVATVEGTAVTFGTPDDQVVFRGGTFGFGSVGPLDFSCTGSTCTSP